LSIQYFGQPGEDICDLEEARTILNFQAAIVMVEGRHVHSFDELTELLKQDQYRGKEQVEVIMAPAVVGG
jgi:hypothetical protein